MKYQHIQSRNGRFVWRLNICGEALRNIDEHDKEHSYATPSAAAFACDLGKFFIREKYGMSSSKVEASLLPLEFADAAQAAGVDLSDLNSVFSATPWRIQEFIRDAGPLLEEQGKRDTALRAVPSANADYLRTLLVALPKRLIDALSTLRKARQLNNLNPNMAGRLATLDAELSKTEQLVRTEINSLLSQ